MRIGIIVAMAQELQLILSLLPHREEETASSQPVYRTFLSSDRELIITQCGIGKVNSALGAVELIHRYSPNLIVSTGVAGGAQHDIHPLQVVASEATAYHDVYCGSNNLYGQIQGLPAVFPSDERLVSIATAIEGVRTGLIASGDWFVDTKEKALSILSNYPTAVAFDMESGAIAQVCYLHSCPFISFRIISDNPLSERSQEQYDNFWEQLSQGSFRVLMDFFRRI